MKKIITYLFIIGTLSATAQDIHFTMYDAMPITTNPATTGVFNGDFRGVINYRNQWATIGSPYKTYALMVDGGFFKNKWKNGYIGAGLNLYKDVAGTTNQIQYDVRCSARDPSATWYLNRPENQNDDNANVFGITTLTIMEVSS